MSIYDKDLLSGKDKVETAIARLKLYCTGKKVLCAFSGGKDSQCVYHLLKMSGIPFEAQYSVTRFEPPELIQFIRANYPDVVFRRAYTRSLVEDIAIKGLPSMWTRWCCDAKHKKTNGFDIAAIGIRWQESARRRTRWTVFGQKQDHTYYVCPICDWTESDVWEFLNSNNIPHCSLYDEGYRRIGCVCCPLATHSEQDAKRWPKIVNAIRLGWHKYYERKRADGFKDRHGIVIDALAYEGAEQECFDRWIRGGLLYPSTRSVEGDAQPCLFAGTGFSESDGANGEEVNNGND